MNEEATKLTEETGKFTFYGNQKRIWLKGRESSENYYI